MAKGLPYFKWYAKDAELDEFYGSLSLEELGLYHHCLNWAWFNEGIPSNLDDFAAVLRISPKTLRRLWVRVGERWVLSEKDPTRFVNPRQEKERQEAITKSNNNSRASEHGQSKGPGFVYLIQRPSDGAVKIGSAVNVARRLAQLRYKYIQALKLVGKFPVENMSAAEVELHRIYENSRIEGEWFTLTAEEITRIGKLLKGDTVGDTKGDTTYHPCPRAYDSESVSDKKVLVSEKKEESYDPLPGWTRFWTAYPAHRVNEFMDVRIWLSVVETPEVEKQVIDALAAFKESPDWKKSNGQYVPRASKFLGERLYLTAPAPSPEEQGTVYRQWDPERDIQ